MGSIEGSRQRFDKILKAREGRGKEREENQKDLREIAERLTEHLDTTKTRIEEAERLIADIEHVLANEREGLLFEEEEGMQDEIKLLKSEVEIMAKRLNLVSSEATAVFSLQTRLGREIEAVKLPLATLTAEQAARRKTILQRKDASFLQFPDKDFPAEVQTDIMYQILVDAITKGNFEIINDARRNFEGPRFNDALEDGFSAFLEEESKKQTKEKPQTQYETEWGNTPEIIGLTPQRLREIVGVLTAQKELAGSLKVRSELRVMLLKQKQLHSGSVGRLKSVFDENIKILEEAMEVHSISTEEIV